MSKKDSDKQPLVLVDGSSYLYRAFHAMPGLSNSSGEPTGAVYGVTNMLRKLLADYDPQYIAVVFDAKGKTFRNDLYPEYKANRPPMPEELRPQVPLVHDIVEAMGLNLLIVDGVEADDVIGTLATQAAKEGRDALISSGDKDLAQLVNKHINMVDTMKDVTYDHDGVVDKFGVPPERIIDYLTLVGDTSDNIPGVPKVGPKTAAKWLEEYGTLDNLIAHADEIPGKVGENLREALDQIPLSKELVTIKRDVKLKQKPKDLSRQELDETRLRDLFAMLEFRTWLAELGGTNVAETPADADGKYEAVLTMKAFDAWHKRLQKAKLFAFDTETTSLNVMDAEIVGVCFTDKVGKGAYVPLAHNYPGAPDQLDRDEVLKKLKPLLEDPKQEKVGQNLKYDAEVLANYDIDLQGIRFDTMLESYVLDSTASRHDMDSLALKYLGHKTIKYEEVAGKGKGQITFNDVALEQAVPYAAEDADITLRLHEELWPRLKKIPSLEKLFSEIEMPLVKVLVRMERTGVKIDAAMLRKQSQQLAKRILEIEAMAHKSAGQPFNLGSPKQIQEVLYDKLELPVLKKTPKGAPSTAEEVLQELALDYELPELILEWRGLSKLRSTYTDKLPEMISPRTGRVHTSYHQAVAATGRFSSSDPNLQNIPVRSAEGRRIRQAFVPEKGNVMMSADYSQIELRIMAHLSKDKGLQKAFSEGADIHSATAAEVFGAEPDKVTSEQRRNAKAINFGLIYGMSAFGLARQLKIDRGAAQEYIDLYFSRYPGVKEYMDSTRANAHDQGYVETLFGRRLYLPDINASNHNRRQYAERTAINAPMQGTAADLIKLAMLAVDKWIQKDAPEIKMIMQVHDELVFEIPKDMVQQAEKKVRELMTGVAKLDVPLVVDVGTGKNWDEAH
ncbi:MAG: DNA polymerase I [Acidithiobacillales bacterium SG8_45]|nr:MAG: DNA polymerase I [Acidithiobacillales bacterium SG8_45]